jgi:hypothetical protein
LQHGELMAQHQYLDILGTIPAAAQHQQVDHEPDETIEAGHALILAVMESRRSASAKHQVNTPDEFSALTRSFIASDLARSSSPLWSARSIGRESFPARPGRAESRSVSRQPDLAPPTWRRDLTERAAKAVIQAWQVRRQVQNLSAEAQHLSYVSTILRRDAAETLAHVRSLRLGNGASHQEPAWPAPQPRAWGRSSGDAPDRDANAGSSPA